MSNTVCGECMVDMVRGSKRVTVQNYVRNPNFSREPGGDSRTWLKAGPRQTTSVTYTCPTCYRFIYQCMNVMITPMRPAQDERVPKVSE